MLVVLVLVMLVYVEVEMVKLLVVVEVNVLVVSVVLVSVPRMLVVIVSSSTSVVLSKASSSGLPGMWSNYLQPRGAVWSLSVEVVCAYFTELTVLTCQGILESCPSKNMSKGKL